MNTVRRFIIGSGLAQSRETAALVGQIRVEATRAGDDPIGRPLPLVATWAPSPLSLTAANKPAGTYLTLGEQLELIRRGHHLLPTLPTPHPAGAAFDAYFAEWAQVAAWKLPVSIVTTQVEQFLYLPWDENNQHIGWWRRPLPDNPGVQRKIVYDVGTQPGPVTVAEEFELRGIMVEGTADPDTTSEHVLAYFVGQRASVDVEIVQKVGGAMVVRYQHEAWNPATQRYDTPTLAEDPITFGEVRYLTFVPYFTTVPNNSAKQKDVWLRQDKDGNRTHAGTLTALECYAYRSEADPQGPIEAWVESGTHWVEGLTPTWATLQAQYPDPPLVLWVSNNEGRQLGMSQAQHSLRYLAAHPGETEQYEVAKNINDGYTARFNAMFAAIRAKLGERAPAWGSNTRFVAYNEVLPFTHGRWGGWQTSNHARYYPDNLFHAAAQWDGASPEYYNNNWEVDKWDFTAFSAQTEFQNVAWMLPLLYAEKSDFWYEASTWDGVNLYNADWPASAFHNRPLAYANIDEPFTAGRYKGWLRWVLWLTFPRALREFRMDVGYVDGALNQAPIETALGTIAYFQAHLDVVDEVWNDATLRRFWRKGVLLPHPTRTHPYRTSVATERPASGTWFALECSANDWPAADTALTFLGNKDAQTQVRVWALALELGESPDREWLVYAFSPQQDRTGVVVAVPGYGDVTLDVPQQGVFHVVAEAAG